MEGDWFLFPWGVGGVVAYDNYVNSELLAQAIRLSQELICRYLEIKMLHELNPEVPLVHKLHLNKLWVTTRMDLTPDPRQLWDSLDKKRIRGTIRKTEREGIQVILDDTQEGINQFSICSENP